MKRMAIQFNEEVRSKFEEAWNEVEQLGEEIVLVNHSLGMWGMYVPEEATFEEFKEDIESILMPYGFWSGKHYEFV